MDGAGDIVKDGFEGGGVFDNVFLHDCIRRLVIFAVNMR